LAFLVQATRSEIQDLLLQLRKYNVRYFAPAAKLQLH